MNTLTVHIDVPINTGAQTINFPNNNVIDNATVKGIALYNYDTVTQDSNGVDTVAVADSKFMHVTIKRDNKEIFSRVPFVVMNPTANNNHVFEVNQKIDINQCFVVVSKPITKVGTLIAVIYYES